MLQTTLTEEQQRHEHGAFTRHWRDDAGLHLFQGKTGVIRNGKTGFPGTLIGCRPKGWPVRAEFAHCNMETRKK